MIFLSVVGSFAGALTYDKWQTKRQREKWCKLVSHIAEESLATKAIPRRVTVYLAAPPGDGLRSAREHFHNYVKPILVSAALDWDVVEGRKEGDVRHKTAEKIRKRRKKNGEGEPLPEEEAEDLTLESIREQNGDYEYPGVAGDIVIGRHTWKEYIRGLHEGYLGPPDPPTPIGSDTATDEVPHQHKSGEPPVGDAAADAMTEMISEPLNHSTNSSPESSSMVQSLESVTSAEAESETKPKDSEEKKKEEEKPKRRFPPSYILPENYQSATLSPSTPEILGPSAEVRFPHLLGIRNTPIRMYRFLTRRNIADEVGRQVATAVLASHRPYGTISAVDSNSASESPSDVPEQQKVLAFEEKDWWKTVRQPRKEHEESVWIEPMAFDERISSRMRSFQLTFEDEERAKRIAAGLDITQADNTEAA